jgi:VanZ family protein
VTGAWTPAHRWARAVFAAAVFANLVVLYWPRPVSQGGIPDADKIVHAAIFAVVAASGLRARLPLAWVVGLLAAHAVTSELVQHWFLANRTGDPADVAADLVGVAVGVFIGLKLASRTGVATAESGGSSSS